MVWQVVRPLPLLMSKQEFHSGSDSVGHYGLVLMPMALKWCIVWKGPWHQGERPEQQPGLTDRQTNRHWDSWARAWACFRLDREIGVSLTWEPCHCQTWSAIEVLEMGDRTVEGERNKIKCLVSGRGNSNKMREFLDYDIGTLGHLSM